MWKNQLKEYKLQEGIGYQKLANATGLNKQTIVRMCGLDEVGVLNMRLKNFIVLHNELGIDMTKGIDYGKAKLLKLTHKKTL